MMRHLLSLFKLYGITVPGTLLGMMVSIGNHLSGLLILNICPNKIRFFSGNGYRMN